MTVQNGRDDTPESPDYDSAGTKQQQSGDPEAAHRCIAIRWCGVTAHELTRHLCGHGDGITPIRSCVRPSHLAPGDNAANARDRMLTFFGRRAKLDATKVLAISAGAAQHVPPEDLAERYGVSVGTVSSVVARRSWRAVI